MLGSEKELGVSVGGFWQRPLRRSVSLILATTMLAGCQLGVTNPQGPVASANLSILLAAVVIMLAVVVPTLVAVLLFAWWFRASNTRAKHLPDWAYSGQLELLVWSIPVLVVLFLGGVGWIGSHQLDPARPLESKDRALEVQVVSLDWKWLFIYPDQGVAAVNQLVVPAGVPVHFSLTSGSVMNAFFIPQLGSMIYTMNGMTTQLNLQADRPGTYYGQSSHFSGDGFPGMHFEVRAVPQAAFDSWVQATKGPGPALDGKAYEALAKQSSDTPPSTFRAVDARLFNDIVTQKLAPGPGPQDVQASVSPKMEH